VSARDVPTAARQLGAAALRVRGPLSMSRFLRSEVLAGHGIPHGDGRPVVLLPPAAAGDWLMPVMLAWLRRINYSAYRSSIGLHIDCSDRTMARVIPRLEQIADSNDRKLTLVGHSRGGLLARAIAAHRPDLIERVITLASPLNEPFAVKNLTLAAAANLARSRMQHRRPDVGCLTEACTCPYGQAFRAELPVPLISLFTRHDDVVRWEACVVDGARNIEVRGTHVGLLASRNVYTSLSHALTGSCDAPGTDWCTTP
jgi:triacylglycerol lipase